MTWPRWHQWPQRSRPVRSCKASWICPWRNDNRGVRGLQAPTQMHSIMSLAKVEDGWLSWTSFWSCNYFWGLTGIRWVSARTYLQTRNLYRIIMNPFQTRRFKWSKHHPNIGVIFIYSFIRILIVGLKICQGYLPLWGKIQHSMGSTTTLGTHRTLRYAPLVALSLQNCPSEVPIFLRADNRFLMSYSSYQWRLAEVRSWSWIVLCLILRVVSNFVRHSYSISI
jgi:hypothetical protein